MQPAITSDKIKPNDARRWIYPGLLLIIYSLWFFFMATSNSWGLFEQHWAISATMSFGSFVAGATAEGGAAVAFPVFTKVLNIPSTDARTFGLMIQAVGMTMAGVMIYVQRIRILPKVVLWVTLGGIFGQILGTYLFIIPAPFPKILFTFIATAFGIALGISRWGMQLAPQDDLPDWDTRYQGLFFVVGIVGGSFAANVGSGIDMLTFIVLTLTFGINEKISTPTTVTIMGLNSIVGFFLHGVVSQDIGIAWEYWLVAIPIVILGAPLGAIVAAKVKRDHIIIFLLFLITVELVTTIWLVPFTTASILITAIAVVMSFACFATMLHYRSKRFGQMKP